MVAMHMGFRVTRFPADAAEAAELALSACLTQGSQLVVFAEHPDDLVIVNAMDQYAACPCHADVTPLNVERLARIMLIRVISREDQGTAVCGWHVGLHAAALSADNLVDSLVIDGTRWSSWKDREGAAPWQPVPQTGLSISDLRWQPPTQRGSWDGGRSAREHRMQQPRRRPRP
ncbi:hypothetical protein acdb102_17620 [Acidothermaceae bacterium B102]|nr:hypothetical protein acdb102_17620 [Acidothermaceae bacterium B102]